MVRNADATNQYVPAKPAYPLSCKETAKRKTNSNLPSKSLAIHVNFKIQSRTWKFKLENKGKDLNKIYNAKEFTVAEAYSTSWVEINNW